MSVMSSVVLTRRTGCAVLSSRALPCLVLSYLVLCVCVRAAHRFHSIFVSNWETLLITATKVFWNYLEEGRLDKGVGGSLCGEYNTWNQSDLTASASSQKVPSQCFCCWITEKHNRLRNGVKIKLEGLLHHILSQLDPHIFLKLSRTSPEV